MHARPTSALSPFDAAKDRSAIRAITLGTTRWYLRLDGGARPGCSSVLEKLSTEVPRAAGDGASPDRILAQSAACHCRRRGRRGSRAEAGACCWPGERRAACVSSARRAAAAGEGGMSRSPLARPIRSGWSTRSRPRGPSPAESILMANNGHPPMVLRVDLSRTSVADVIAELAEGGYRGQGQLPGPPAPSSSRRRCR